MRRTSSGADHNVLRIYFLMKMQSASNADGQTNFLKETETLACYL